MTKKWKTLLSLSFVGVVGLLLGVPEQAGATQVHVPSEGLYVHQIAHLFFAAAMAILLYWLRERQLVRQRGWRLIQLGACFFILWNLDAFAVHILDGRGDLFTRIDRGTWHESIQFDPNLELLAVLYYLGKMDHLWCAPGMILLYFGLRSLLADAEKARALSPSAGEYSASGNPPREHSTPMNPASPQDNAS
jgi:hypothetical protein